MRLTKRKIKEHRVAVLVIDDDADFGFMMNDIIQSLGCKCDLLFNAEDIYENFDKNYYDLVFADVCMPNYDLDTMLSYCNNRFPQIKIVVMSAFVKPETVRKYLSYENVIQVFEKPSSDLRQVINKCLAKIMGKVKV